MTNTRTVQTDARSANAMDREIGARIRTRRQELGMSQTALADAIGVTFQQVQKYERGTNRVAASKLLLVMQVLTMPVSMVFPAAAPGPLDTPSAGTIDSPHMVALLKAFAAIQSPEQRKAVLAAVRAIADQAAEKPKAAVRLQLVEDDAES